MLRRAASRQRQQAFIWIAAVASPRLCIQAPTLAGRKYATSKLSNRRFLTSKIEGKVDAKGTVVNETPATGDTTGSIGQVHGTLSSSAGPRSSEDYKGPLALTFKRLKIFSLASLSLSSALTPFMFVLESTLPMSARVSLAGMALTTTGISTLLIGWCGKPYVETLRRVPDEKGGFDGFEMTTMSILLRKRITRVYDVDFLVETERGFAKWELAQMVSFTHSETGAKALKKAGDPGQEETVAETFSVDGKLLGSWVVKWEKGGVGRCRPVGKIIR